MNMTDRFAADAERAALTEPGVATITRDRFGNPNPIMTPLGVSPAPIPAEHRDHVLVWGIPTVDDAHVEHHDGTRQHAAYECVVIEAAARAFIQHIAFDLDEWTDYENNPLTPGRYLCSFDSDGVFEIGSRIS